jgi:hypothetical protein
MYDKGEKEDLSEFEHTEYWESMQNFQKFITTEGRNGFSPERLGEAVHLALSTAKPKARYAVIMERFKNWTLSISKTRGLPQIYVMGDGPRYRTRWRLEMLQARPSSTPDGGDFGWLKAKHHFSVSRGGNPANKPLGAAACGANSRR